MEQNNGLTAPDLGFVNTPAPDATPAPDQGNLALSPAPAPDPAVAATPPPVDPALAQPPAPQPEVRPQPTVPLPELIEERRARQEAQRHAANMQAQLQQLYEAQQRAQQPQPQPIDPVTNPEAAYAALQHQNQVLVQEMQNMAVHQRANMSEMLAKREHGAEVVTTARDAAIQAGLGQHFLSRPDPYGELMQWHKAQQIASEIGNDPKAYEARVEAQVRAKILAEMRAGTPPPRNIPPSLATATQAGTATQVVPEASEFFKQMMNRKG